MTPRIFLINGPNLNLLGLREPHIYGHDTLSDVEKRALEAGLEAGVEVICRQSNYEGDLVTWIQEARTEAEGIVMNAGAYTHTSIAIHDALKAISCKKIELHLSNPHAREAFRHHSYITPAVDGTITGFGGVGYTLAVEAARELVGRSSSA